MRATRPALSNEPLSPNLAIMGLITRIADKAGALGSVVSAMGCAACFPAIASLGAAIGLGFLQEYEGLFISKLLPLFAVVALLANALGWLSHRQWYRSLLGMVGPAIVLAAMLLFFGNWWTANLLYVGLALMIGVSIWDLLSPANRRCELPPKHG
ncbi:mercuric ion transport protein [Shewanella fodinae]|uniref:Mercuric ion transport protein n=31 Tax=Pseudomonadota TaxID=1224 RepID=A0A4R2FJB5_9GAMM|nr:mercuric ion transport protein [Shewanella fodinae]GGF03452.1 mercury transporter MerC [Kangiella profundi]